MTIPNLFDLAASVFHAYPADIATLRSVCDETDALRNQFGEDDPRVQAGEVTANNLKGLFTRRIAWACHQIDDRFGLRAKTTGQLATRPADRLTHSTDALMMHDTGQIIDVMSDRDVSWGVKEGDTQPVKEWLAPLPEGGVPDVKLPGHPPPLDPTPWPPQPDPYNQDAIKARLVAFEADLARQRQQIEALQQQLDERFTALETKPVELPALIVEGTIGRVLGHTHPITLKVRKA